MRFTIVRITTSRLAFLGVMHAVVYLAACLLTPSSAPAADYVIQVSVDGMGSSYIKSLIDSGQAPHFKQLVDQGAGTYNSRTDYNYTITLPSHTTMLTSRGVNGTTGHNWTNNNDPPWAQPTIHLNKGSYVASAFDVVHDYGRRTALYTGKTKFSLFDVSYDANNGAIDTTGANNGQDKLDKYYYSSSSSTLTNTFISDMSATPANFAFVHYADPDAAGHNASGGWGSTLYNNSLITIDGYLGSIMDLIQSDPVLQGRTTLIVTADHGGVNFNHSDATNSLDYTIPLWVWGAGVTHGDLYAMNPTRLDPGTGRPAYTDAVQPLRNGDTGNLALDLLNLPAINGSTINNLQDVVVPEPTSLGLLAAAMLLGLRRRR